MRREMRGRRENRGRDKMKKSQCRMIHSGLLIAGGFDCCVCREKKKEIKGKERVPPVEHSAVVFAISCSCV